MNAASFPKIRVSLGSAALLGLRRLRVEVWPTTAYLIVGGRCAWDCAFCPQGRSGAEGEDRLSRVRWPEYPSAQVAGA
ncbi:MAG: hypothetical protein QJR13_02525, partial [Bacillota bacterium]|nr:hypothetical protein [Bacillota bacterium]